MPPKFKALEFVKYDGTGNPYAHLRMFCKMAAYGDNHPLFCQIFLDSLTGPMAIWYVRLEKTSSWREMANFFLEYYGFNTEIAPNRTILQRTEKKSRESFYEYAKGSLQVQPSMMENEMIKPSYYEKMIST